MVTCVQIRKARISDAAKFIGLVKELAKFEKLKGPDKRAEKRLIIDCFKGKQFRLFLAFLDQKAVGYAVYFFTYSTFMAKPTLYLEDIFILEEHRNSGVGNRLFLACAREAVMKGCGRMEFSVLWWNKSAIKFYEQRGARRLREWLYYRLDTKTLNRLAKD